MMVWAAIAALWAIVALWMLAERAVATGWAYRVLSGYAEHRAARHQHALPELDDTTLVTHAAVLQLLDPAMAALFAPSGHARHHGDRGHTTRWYIRADGQLFPTVACTWQGGHRHTWPDGTVSAGSCPSWVYADTRAAGLIELHARGTRRPCPATAPSVPTQVTTDELQGWAVLGAQPWITQERVRR